MSVKPVHWEPEVPLMAGSWTRSHQDTLSFWRDVEVFQPREVKALGKSSSLDTPEWKPQQQGLWSPSGNRERRIILGLSPSPGFPWEPHARATEAREIQDRYRSACAEVRVSPKPWSVHKVYFGILRAQAVHAALEQAAPLRADSGPAADINRINLEERWRIQGDCALGCLTLDENGCLPADEQGVFWSSLLFGLERLGTAPADSGVWSEWQKQATACLFDRHRSWSKDRGRPLDRIFFENEQALLEARLSEVLENAGREAWEPSLLVCSEPARAAKTSEPKDIPSKGASPSSDNPLNSFYIEPLTTVMDALSSGREAPSAPLLSLLDPSPDESRKDWLQDPSSFRAAIAPRRLPLGSWPSEHHLMAAQLGAVAEIAALEDGEGLVAVNGPPGTGKTTLLQDVIAHMVVERARRMSKYVSSISALRKVSFPSTSEGTMKSSSVELPHDDIIRHGLMVVTSNNNAAVENVSRELPRQSKVTPPAFRYLAPLARAWEINGGEAFKDGVWGPVAGVLGKKKNCEVFVKLLRYGGFASGADDAVLPSDAGGLKRMVGHDRSRALTWEPLSWDEARQKFLEALEVEHALRVRVEAALEQGEALSKARRARPQLERAVAQAAAGLTAWEGARTTSLSALTEAQRAAENLAALKQQMETLRDEMLDAQKERKDILEENSLSFIEEKLASLGLFRSKAWRSRDQLLRVPRQRMMALREQRHALRALLASTQEKERSTARAAQEQEAVWKEEHRLRAVMLEDADHAFARAQERIENLEQTVPPAVREEIARWDGSLSENRENHARVPWRSEEWPDSLMWHDARKDVFRKAMAFHEAALKEWAPKMGSALLYHLLRLIESPQSIPVVLREPLWNLLGFIVPVVSTSLASFARQFEGMPPSSIGWLLVDESGQATPASVVWALQHARRAVIVGDPLQIEPVVTIAPALIDRLHTPYRENVEWRLRPDAASVQTLADASMSKGAWVDSAEGLKVWTGLPLRAHRRCVSPMFDISNRIAYDGQMLQTTPNGHIQASGLRQVSEWWDIRPSSSGGGQVVPEEMKALEKFLQQWRTQSHQVVSGRGQSESKSLYIISPFRAVKAAAQEVVKKVGVLGAQVGTVHTFQGKEADTVVLVLGTQPGSLGAGGRRWACQKPNLLNVAVTRARFRLVVIGSREDWGCLDFASVMAALLPAGPSPSSTAAG